MLRWARQLLRKKLQISVTGGRYVLTVRYFQNQTKHDNVEVRKRQSPRCFVRASAADDISLSLGLTAHAHVHYQMAEKVNLAELLRIKEARISTFTAFVGHEFL